MQRVLAPQDASGNAGIQTFTTERVGNNVTVQPRTYAGVSQGEGIQFNASSFYDASGSLQMYGVGSRGNDEKSFRENNNDPKQLLDFPVRIITRPTFCIDSTQTTVM